MAAPRRSWLVFGFSAEEAAGEPSPGPGPRRLEPGPEGIEGIRRVWPAWSYAVLDTGAGLEVLGAGLRRRLPAGCAEALPSETHVLLLRGRGPGAAAEAWPRAAALRGELRGAPAWRRALAPGPRRPPLPLLPGGFAVPRPPFFCELPPAPPLRALALGHEHVLALGANGEVYGWGGGRHGQLGHGGLESEQQPRLVEALAGVPMRVVAAGGWHSASISEGGDLYMWGWNESGQLALPSKAVAEEQDQDEDADTGEDAAGRSEAVPGPWDGTARAERRCSQGPRSCRPPGSSRAPPSFPFRRSRPCWTCPRTWRLVPSAAGPGTRPQSHETASSTPGAGVNTGSWAMGTTPALTGPGAWSTWWQRGCGPRRWCAGPGTPTCACWSSEGHEAVPRPSLCAWSKGRQRKALPLPHGAALGPWRSGRGWADTVGGFPPPGPQLRPRSCAAASSSWGCTSDKDRTGLHGFIKSLFVTAAVVLRVAYTYRCPAAPAPTGTGKKAGAEEPGPALSPSQPPG